MAKRVIVDGARAGQPWHGSRRHKSAIPVGERGTYSDRRAMAEASRSLRRYAQRADHYRKKAKARFGELEQWKPWGNGRRWRLVWRWDVRRCKGCGEPRTASLRCLAQLAFKRNGVWVVRSKDLTRQQTFKPELGRPSLPCICPGRRLESVLAPPVRHPQLVKG